MHDGLHVAYISQYYRALIVRYFCPYPRMQSARQVPHKYSKVSQQRKFHLLNLIYKERLPIREAARVVKVNYLTAKTIVFFHKNHYKSYQFDIRPPSTPHHRSTASYAPIRKMNALSEKLIAPKPRVQVISSIGNILSPCRQFECPLAELTGEAGIKDKQTPPQGFDRCQYRDSLFHSQQVDLPLVVGEMGQEREGSTDSVK